jgi:uncharacterized protein YukE
MDPQIQQFLNAFLAAINTNTDQIKELSAQLGKLEARFNEHTSVTYTTYSDWKRIEEGHAHAMIQANKALREVEELKAIALGFDEKT